MKRRSLSKALPRVTLLFPAWVMSVHLLSCGSRENQNLTLTPSGAFDDKKEIRTEFHRCDGSGATGCGEINASGSLVKGGFIYRDLFVTCGEGVNGYTVSLRNALTSSATFQLNISLYGVNDPDVLYTCKGLIRLSGTEDVKKGSCDVLISVHNVVVGATSTQNCLVRFSGNKPVSGIISCKILSGVNGYVMIGEGSKFQCPN